MIIWRMARVAADVDATVLPDGDSIRVVIQFISQPFSVCLDSDYKTKLWKNSSDVVL